MYKMPRKFDTCYGLLPMLTETQWGQSLYEFKFIFPRRLTYIKLKLIGGLTFIFEFPLYK